MITDSKKIRDAMRYCVDPDKEVTEQGSCICDICPYAPIECPDCMDLLMQDAINTIAHLDGRIKRLTMGKRNTTIVVDLFCDGKEKEKEGNE